jgi:hypothetical protein
MLKAILMLWINQKTLEDLALQLLRTASVCTLLIDPAFKLLELDCFLLITSESTLSLHCHKDWGY